MSTLAEIEQAADALSPEEVRLLMAHLAEKVERQSSNPLQKRMAGLHAGQWVLAPDFDALLPDEFWLGKDA